MATKKISEFTTLGSLSDSDILPVVNAGSNKKITGATLKTYAQSGLTIPTDVSDLTDTTSLLGGGSGATTLSALTDVALEDPSQGQVLTWNNNQSKWENQGLPSSSEITNTDPEGSIYSVSVGTDGVVTMTTARGGIEFGAMPEVGGPSHLHIMRPAGQNSSTDLYFGDDYNYVKMPGLYGSNPTTQQGVEIGSSINEGAVSVWKFGTDGDLVLPAGKTIRDTSGTDLLADSNATLLEPYKGFRAHYGTMYNNTDDENGPINKLVIYKSTATPSSAIDTSTNSDDFQVTGLTGSDVVAMLVVVTDGTDWDIQTPTATLKTFVEKIIDEVILDEGVEGDVNTVSAMRTAFYANFSNFGTVIPNPKTDLEFFDINNQFSISPQYTTGDGAGFSGISYNMDNDTLDLGSWGQGAPNTHEVNDVHVIPGNTIQDANGSFLQTPANDVTVTITGVADGAILSYTVTGTLPRPSEIWPSNYIDDGGDDEYDSANVIHTNLETEISYNDGNVVTGASAFGGGDYVVTYQAGIFGVFVTGADISTIGTSGNDGGYGNDSGSSGFDGDGVAVTGSLYGAADSGVNIGDFVFTGSTLTATDDDLYIKAVDDLWLDALEDDIHIRANDDVRIKVGYDFQNDSAQQEWRFDTFGYISFPDGTTQSTAYTGGAGTGDVTFISEAVIGTGNTDGSGGLYLAAGTDSVTALQYLRVRGGDDSGHIHLDTGDNTIYDQFFGDDAKYLKLEAGANGNIVIGTIDSNSNTYEWQFGSNGNLSVPGTIKSSPAVAQVGHQFTIATANGGGTNNNGASGVTLTDSDLTVLIQTGWTAQFADYGPVTVSVVTINGDGTTFIGMGASSFYATLPVTFTSADYAPAEWAPITVSSGNSAWSFDEDSVLTFPRDTVVNTDPILTIVGGTTPTITSTDASLAGPAPLAISADSVNIAGFNGNRIIMSADAGEIITDQQLVLVANAVNPTNTRSWTFDTTGKLTLPEGSIISDAPEIVTVTLDQFNDAGFTGTQVFAKVSDTLYQVLPSGPTMELVSGIWYLKVGVSSYYNSTDLVTWEESAGSLPTPVGTLTTVAGMSLTVDGNEWLFDDDGNLTTPSNLVIGPRPGGGSHIQQNDAALEIVGEGANSVVQIGWTANQSEPDSVALIAMNYPNGGEGNILFAVGNNSTTVNYWLFDHTGNLKLPAGGDIVDSTGNSVLGGGGTTLPIDASGYLVNDGAGNLSWAAGDGTFSGDYDDLTNKPTIPTDVSDLSDTTNLLFSGSYNDLSNTPALFDGDYVNLTNTPALFDGDYTSLANTPSLFSGDYDDLTSKPALFDGAYSSLTGTPALFSGSYVDLTNKPTIPTDVSDLTDTTSLLSSSGKIGYASGSSVTQTSNRGNGVAINALSGTIVTVNAGMVAGEIGAFPVTNNQVDTTTDIVLVQVVSPNLGNYNVIANPNSGIGGFYLTLQNISGFPISAEAVTIRFIVIKAPNA
jgi:hypothetical protein